MGTHLDVEEQALEGVGEGVAELHRGQQDQDGENDVCHNCVCECVCV